MSKAQQNRLVKYIKAIPVNGEADYDKQTVIVSKQNGVYEIYGYKPWDKEFQRKLFGQITTTDLELDRMSLTDKLDQFCQLIKTELNFVSIHFIEFTRVMDYVVYYDHDGYEDAAPAGTTGVIVDHKYAWSTQAPYNYPLVKEFDDGKKVGYYWAPCSVIVRFSNGAECEVSCSNLMFVENHQETVKRRQADPYSSSFKQGRYECSLETPTLYVGDKLSSITLSEKLKEPDTLEFVVTDVHFNYEKSVSYTAQVCNQDGYRFGTHCTDKDKPSIISRGNHYKWCNDQKDQLSFKDIREELSFYIQVGLVEQIKCPATKNYHWTFDEYHKALETGQCLVMSMSPSFFGSKSFLQVYEVSKDLPDLIERVIQHRESVLENEKKENQIPSVFAHEISVKGGQVSYSRRIGNGYTPIPLNFEEYVSTQVVSKGQEHRVVITTTKRIIESSKMSKLLADKIAEEVRQVYLSYL